MTNDNSDVQNYILIISHLQVKEQSAMIRIIYYCTQSFMIF